MKKTTLIITPNPAVDYLFWQKENTYQISNGGKGVNVQRALKLLQHPAKHLSIAQNRIRGNITVYPKNGQPRRFMGAGIPPTVRQRESFKRKFRSEIRSARAVLICGSAPKGCQNLFPWMIRTARKYKTPVWVDTSQPTLGLSLRRKPDFLKPNLKELEGLKRRPLKKRREQINALISLCRRGVPMAALTLGEQGAFLCKEGEIWYAKAPRIKSVSELGCGDVFLAGLYHFDLKNKPAPYMLTHAMALASASARSPLPGDFKKADYQSLKPEIKVQKII